MSSIRNTILTNLKTALAAIEDDTNYPLNIHHVSLFDENVLKQTPEKTPMVMIIDTGREALIVADSTHYRYNWEIMLRGLIEANTSDGLHEKINEMISTLKQFIDGDPSLGDNVLDFRFVGVEGNRYSADKKIADTFVRCECTYWCIAGTF